MRQSKSAINHLKNKKVDPESEVKDFCPSFDIRFSYFLINFLKVAGFKNLAKKIPFSYKKFWNQRYKQYGFDIMYCGNKGRTKKQNFERRMKKIEALSKFMKKLNVNSNFSVLDIGCGVGIFTNFFFKNRFKNYKGIDLTKGVINNLKNKFPRYNFKQRDIGKDAIDGTYDLIIMISVTQHIINDKHFKFAMNNIQNSLNKNGLFLVTDMANVDRRDSLYTRRRPLSYYKKNINELKFIDMMDFEGGLSLFCFRKIK